MNIATGLAHAATPSPQLVEQAIKQALQAADCDQAASVLLFLSRHFRHQTRPALLAAARTAGCMDIAGCTSHGVMTEHGWQVDQPAVAAMVFPTGTPHAPGVTLGFCNHFPYHWREADACDGLLDGDGEVWAHGRQVEEGCAETRLPGSVLGRSLSPGLLPLSPPLTLNDSLAYDLYRIAGQPALESLRDHLPPMHQDAPPFHQLFALTDPGEPAVPILSAGPGASLVVGDMLDPGSALRWAMRLPHGAERDMEIHLAATVDRLKADKTTPDYALLFSCIGRGPVFYGDTDRDHALACAAFPGLPLIGAYGTGQIVHQPQGNRLFNNATHLLLCSTQHV